MAFKKAVIVTGYSKNPSELVAWNLKKMLEQKGCRVVVVDPFRDERKKWIFRETLLSWCLAKDMISSVNSALTEANPLLEDIDYMFCYSYGAVAGMFQDVVKVHHYIFLSPALGAGTVKFGTKEKFFGLFVPGLKEMTDEDFQEQIFERLCSLRKAGSKIKFFLPRNPETEWIEDEKVEYSANLIAGHFDLFRETTTLPVKIHRDMIGDHEVIKEVLKELEMI